MKNLILLFSLIVLCASCNKNPVSFEEKIIGEWQVNSFVINSCPDASDNVALVTSNGDGCVEVMGDTACFTLILKENGVAEVSTEISDLGESEFQIMSYVLDEENNSFSLCEEMEGECATFTLDGDDLYNEMDEDGCICVFGFRKTI